MKNIVSEHETDGIIPDEIGPDGESLGKTVRRLLLCILEADSDIGAIPEQAPEARQIVRRGDNEYLPDPGKHKH